MKQNLKEPTLERQGNTFLFHSLNINIKHLLFRDPLFSTSFGMIMRKHSAHSEMINIEIMRHYAYGLSMVSDKFRRNGGILGPRNAACGDIVPPAVCQLSPEAEKGYVKSQEKLPLGFLHLKHTFILCGTGIGLAIIVFFTEISMSRMQKRKNIPKRIETSKGPTVKWAH